MRDLVMTSVSEVLMTILVASVPTIGIIATYVYLTGVTQ